jgi:hypothetical protein
MGSQLVGNPYSIISPKIHVFRKETERLKNLIFMPNSYIACRAA